MILHGGLELAIESLLRLVRTVAHDAFFKISAHKLEGERLKAGKNSP